MNRKDSFVSGEFYHIYNRGNSKQDIFINEHDYDRFSKLLYLCNSLKNINFRDDIIESNINAYDFNRGDQIVSIGAWVLMPNHFHIYITPRSDLGGLVEKEENLVGLFMQKLCTSYSMYFNKKNERTGSLFEGRFKSVHIENDEQAKYLFSYIHLNPVKLVDPLWKERGIKDKNKTSSFLDKYKWSSYLDFMETKRPENKIINTKFFPDYFSDKNIMQNEIFDWLNFDQR